MIADDESRARSFEDVARDEAKVIQLLREAPEKVPGAAYTAAKKPEGAPDQFEGFLERGVGLALSGGGIRSATFNLGVLQALAEQGLLTTFDYLSTVSGGGYIGSWLSAWIWRKRERIMDERLENEFERYWTDRQEKEREEQKCPEQKKGEQEANQEQVSREPEKAAVKVQQGLANSADAAAGNGSVKEKKREKQKWLEQKKADEAKEAAVQVQQELANSADAYARNGSVAAEAAASSAGSKKEPEEITFLRNFSNYLTPKLGLLSYDTLAAVAIYLRNFLLNQTILVLALSSLLLLPRAVARLGGLVVTWAWGSLWLAESLLLLALIFINLNLMDQRRERKDRPCWYVKPFAVVFLITVPLVIVAMIIGFLATDPPDKWGLGPRWPLFCGIVILGLCIVAWLVARLIASEEGAVPDPGSPSLRIWNFIGLLAGVVAAAGLLIVLRKIFNDGGTRDLWVVAVWGMPAGLGVFALAVAAQIGVTGRPLNEGSREWWGRLGGSLLGITATWIAVSACALYGPYWVTCLHTKLTASLGVAWIVSTMAGVVTAASAYTGKPGSRKLIEVLPRIAPYVFIAGLLVALSYALYLSLAYHTIGYQEAAEASRWVWYRDAVEHSTGPLWVCVVLCASTVLAALLLSWRVDINVFSLHRFYLYRLERCYLGASNRRRRETENPFTGFDANDRVRLEDLIQRPYPIINTAINLTRVKRLAWQERKAASFVFTPKYCGFELKGGKKPFHAYKRTHEYLTTKKGDRIGLAKAFAVSGAAVSPNMGYHSTPAVAFLLTVFNLRLGLWMENPGKQDVWEKSCCLVGLWYLLRELFGATDEKKKFVYLSDGGHFENLGIYELVRRHCRFIVASDASMDRSFSFDDLGNAVRKCYVDLGVPIEIDTRAIVPDAETHYSEHHCAVGIIHYEHASPDESPGYLLYIKPSLTGSEPIDIKQYAAAHREYPHESTTDQWFAESQFESYRRLGYKIARTVLKSVDHDDKRDSEALFVSLRERWYPPSDAPAEAFTKHSATLKRIYETLRTTPELDFLHQQIYPEWSMMVERVRKDPDNWLPYGESQEAKIRAGFYVCNQLIQLMEDVYTDLKLETQYDHPDNRGWMNLFMHWSWSGMFRVTWAISSCTYGARFQSFCERRLKLDLDEDRRGAGDKTHWFEVRCDEPKSLAKVIGGEARDMLNSYEVSLLKKFREPKLVQSLDNKERDETHYLVYPLQLVVSDPGADRTKECRFVFGFCVVYAPPGKEPVLCYYRVQDHLRKMGLARRGLEALPAVLLCPSDPEKLRLKEFYSRSLSELDIDTESLQRFKKLFKSVARAESGGAD